jgi:hypothetical protein
MPAGVAAAVGLGAEALRARAGCRTLADGLPEANLPALIHCVAILPKLLLG